MTGLLKEMFRAEFRLPILFSLLILGGFLLQMPEAWALVQFGGFIVLLRESWGRVRLKKTNLDYLALLRLLQRFLCKSGSREQ